MGYRALRISRTAYRGAFDQLYLTRPDLQEAPFKDQMEAFFKASLMYSDWFSRNMDSFGNESIEVMCNAESIQKAWAAENDVSWDEDNWILQITLAQIEKFRPDVIFIQGISTDPEGFLPPPGFSEDYPFVKLVVAFSGFPHQLDRFDGINLVIASVPTLNDHYRANGIQSQLIYHGFDAGVLDKLGAFVPVEITEPEYDFTFCGLSGLGFGQGHVSRYWELIQLMFTTPLIAWALDRDNFQYTLEDETIEQLSNGIHQAVQNMSPAEAIEAVRNFHVDAFGNDSPMVPLARLMPDKCHPPVYGMEMYTLLQRSRVILNRHTDAMGIHCGNMRMFEATGVATCVLTNDAPNVRDLYEPDVEVVTYASTEECAEKVRYLLDHEDERRRIAEAGHKRTLVEHNVANRCAEIDAAIKAKL
jgi:spore maturation protein CgeB